MISQVENALIGDSVYDTCKFSRYRKSPILHILLHMPSQRLVPKAHSH